MKSSYKKTKNNTPTMPEQKSRIDMKGLSLVTQYAEQSGLFEGMENPLKSNKVSSKDILLTEIALLTLGRAKPENVKEFECDPEYFRAVLGLASDLPTAAVLKNRLASLGTNITQQRILQSNEKLLCSHAVTLSASSTGYVSVDIDLIYLDKNKKKSCPDGRILAAAWIGNERYLCNLALFQSIEEWRSGCMAYLQNTLLTAVRLMQGQEDTMLLVRTSQGDDLIPGFAKLPRYARERTRAIVKQAGSCENICHDWKRICNASQNTINTGALELCGLEPEQDVFMTTLQLPEIAVLKLYEGCEDCKLLQKDLCIDLDLETLSHSRTAESVLIVRLSVLAYNILKLIGSTHGKKENAANRIRRTINCLIASTGT